MGLCVMMNLANIPQVYTWHSRGVSQRKTIVRIWKSVKRVTDQYLLTRNTLEGGCSGTSLELVG
jgi:hypothetical protein